MQWSDSGPIKIPYPKFGGRNPRLSFPGMAGNGNSCLPVGVVVPKVIKLEEGDESRKINVPWKMSGTMVTTASKIQTQDHFDKQHLKNKFSCFHRFVVIWILCPHSGCSFIKLVTILHALWPLRSLKRNLSWSELRTKIFMIVRSLETPTW